MAVRLQRRRFCLIDEETNKQSGRVSARTPKRAALYYTASLMRKYKKLQQPIPMVLKITIRETTPNSSKKIYMYEYNY